MEDTIEAIIKNFHNQVRNFNGSEPSNSQVKWARENDYTFIRIPRTASTSIHDTIGGDIRHASAAMLKRELGSDWGKVFKFSMCRNPYTRFTSMYNMINRSDIDVNEYFEINGWMGMKHFLEKRMKNFLPQYHFLLIKNEISVDYLGRFEELDKAWKHIQKITEIFTPLPHLAKTHHTRLNERTKDMIYRVYQKDFETLGYDK